MTDFDAIVVGSGMSGGWVAKELSERGLKVLVLERGRNIDPAEDYTDQKTPWEIAETDPLTDEEEEEYHIQKSVYAFSKVNKKLWVKDTEHPYETAPGTDYIWRRGYHLGGRSIMWARQSYRFAPLDFEANAQDGYGVDWPVRYDDIAPWYDYVENFAGISGSKEGLEQLPDGDFLPPFELNCMEKKVKAAIEERWPERKMITGRAAHLREARDHHKKLGRVQCQVRSRCENGCVFGGYFSAVSATLPAARRTGNATIVTDAIVHSVDYDPQTKRITGVKVIDSNTMQRRTYTAKLVFLNASAIASAGILMNSADEENPNGLANRSDQLGRNLMDHVTGARAQAVFNDFPDSYYFGRRPNGIYIPRYVNIGGQDQDFVRGFGYQGSARRVGWNSDIPGIGQDLKEKNRDPGPWIFWLTGFGEVLPDENSRMTLHPTKTDKWGVPIPVMDARYGENEEKMMRKASKDAAEMLKAAGGRIIYSSEDDFGLSAPGNTIHEMGTARMGRDPMTSVLNKWNQAHDIDNLFMTDGAFMTSSACQNPSLTYMAFSARAANYATDLFEQGVFS
ncbi:GMC family oxidoreductase [Parvularcula sp. ZS-1/3]|uniref:GMC family oxidoreductase n=1 Tax=Parvularcula mediterranea TaxID=2732508 RepID=A0A7Y3RJZ9_9PROT|nr:GMC family oxidoreductase [Parvularcula mediterranea]NNU15478.1 GMC family oxidoreductase [Parvularcula mediterranea]